MFYQVIIQQTLYYDVMSAIYNVPPAGGELLHWRGIAPVIKSDVYEGVDMYIGLALQRAAHEGSYAESNVELVKDLI